MIVRELITKLGFKTDENAVKKYELAIKSLTTAYVALSAAITAAAAGMFAFVDSAAKTGDELDKTKKVVGLSIKQMQLLGGAAALSGVEHDNFVISMEYFAKSVGMARMGMMEQLRAFQMLGVSLRDSNGRVKNQYKLLLDVAEGFKNLKNQQDRAVVAQLLFSRGGGRMLNIFKNGSKGVIELTKEVAKYAFLMDKEAVKKSAKFTDTMYLVKLAIKGVKDQIGLALMPIFQKMLTQTLHWIVANRKLLALRLKEFFKGLFIVATAVGKTFAFLVNTFSFLANILRVINDNFGTLAKLLEGLLALKLISKIGLIKKALFGLLGMLDLLLAPETLIVGAVIALLLLLDDVATYFKGGDSLIGRFMQRFPKVVATISSAIKPIKTAIYTYIIDPLNLIINIIHKIQSMVYKMLPFKGISGVGPTIIKHLFTTTTFLPSVANMFTHPSIAAASHQINVNTHVAVTVPHGTTTEQQSFLQSAAKDAFHSNFSNEIRKALTVFPGVEK